MRIFYFSSLFAAFICLFTFSNKINAQKSDKFKPKDWSVQHLSLIANYQLANSFLKSQNNTQNQFSYKGMTRNLTFNARVFTKRGLAFRLGMGLDSVKYSYQSSDLTTNYDGKRRDFKSLIGMEIHFPIARPLWFYTGVYMPFTFTGKDYLQNIKNGAQSVGNVTIDNDGKVHFGLGADLGFSLKIAKFLRLGVEANGTFTQFSQAYWDLTVAEDFANLKQLQGGISATLGIAL
jgi:hypothetical protein